MLKKFFVATIAIVMMFTTFSTVQANTSFTDISGHSLEEELLEAIDRNIMAGVSANRVAPNAQVTRGQFATFLARALNLPAGSQQASFSDVPRTHGLSDGIYRAAGASLVGGYPNGTFRPEQNITREEMAVMIDRAIGYRGVPRQPGELNFIDVADIREMYLTAVQSNAYFGIILGYTTNDPSMMRFAPKQNATRAEAAAFIVRMIRVVEDYEEIIGDTDPVEPDPTPGEPAPTPTPPVTPPVQPPEVDHFQVASIASNGELQVVPTTYSSYDQAKRALTSTRTILLKNGAIKEMAGGIVRPNHPTASIVSVYGNSNLTNATTYMTDDARFGSEVRYMGTANGVIQVEVAGRVGYVNWDQVKLYPTQQTINKRNYYSVSGGELTHHLYNPTADTFSSYRYGKAPGFMRANERYYSWNGRTYFDSAGNRVGEADQYFNALPVKSRTNYTAAELDAYLQAASPGNKPLVGMGQAFINAQERTGINALYIMGKAIHESAWGTSRIAQDKNNLFGLNASDSNPYGNADTFISFEASIMYLAERYILPGYAHQGDWRFEGAFVGNKGAGMNIRYASDMFWGQKIAGHMYRADQFLGGKDLGNYSIGRVNTTGLNVRRGAGTEFPSIFTYRNAGAHVIMINEALASNGQRWYEVSSDDRSTPTGYIHSAYLTPIPYVR
ncbi:S-layer homology domain-containing protein [Paenalkalicoccus suaedae]|uniref:S-layer homology domain-containing protein n=1 Tax=Paenalkalicoccus suaedae TaxID=2592382 RepID=A0A859FHR8_9BACI|nr:S-layer homology domain-containing protein [Paenalkalicoccus suaedae]QKS72388.1 S-layer homology domain-containing protein [Paenalkalicoccus suaedae]